MRRIDYPLMFRNVKLLSRNEFDVKPHAARFRNSLDVVPVKALSSPIQPRQHPGAQCRINLRNRYRIVQFARFVLGHHHPLLVECCVSAAVRMTRL